MTDSVPVLGGSLALGRYRVVKELARGGMGMVYLGRIEGAAGFAKPVVVKRVLSHIDESEGSRSQFIREARLLSELDHPNIVGVIDFGEEGDSYLMVLDYVHGFHVGNWLKFVCRKRGRLEWEFAAYVVIRVLSALHYAHTRTGPDGRPRPIIHRDVSPGNVLIDLQGNVRLLDFGIARASDDGDEFKTQEGIVKGKLPYIAPEMYQSAEASVASDVYAAGVMLYQLLSGKNPFGGRDMSAIVTRVLQYRPPPISSFRDDVPPGLDEVVARAMAKDPKERFATAQAFAFALGALLENPEPEVLESLRKAVASDFSEEMPRLLGIPSLAELDRAWRASSPVPNRAESLERLSLPPLDLDATAIVPVPRTGLLSEDHGRESTTGARLGSAVPLVSTTPSGAPAGGSNKVMILGMLGAGLLAGVIAAGVMFWGRSTPAPSGGQRYLLVERQNAAAPVALPAPVAGLPSEGAATAVSAATTPPDRETAPGPGPDQTAPPVVTRPTGSAQTDSQRLTAAFAKQQSAVQTCFAQGAGQLEGSPQVSVHFQLDEQGGVRTASLSPSALGATSLGQCLVSVARAAQFPALGKPVAFSIPITARVVAK